MDTVEVQFEVTGGSFSDRIGSMQELQQRLERNIKEYCGVTAKVRLMEPHSLDRSMGKATRVLDRRVQD